MSKSTTLFNRWTAMSKSTWAFQVFNKYNDQLNEMMWAYRGANKTIYSKLGSSSAKWEDKASLHLAFDVPIGEESFSNLRAWSDSFNDFDNWVNLNCLMAITSNLETYLSTVISLSLESDPGLLFQSSKSIDGISLLKIGANKSTFNDDIITSITKGTWVARVNAFNKVFGSVPITLKENIGDLDKIRNLRNEIGHAFGRDINTSRNHEVNNTLQMKKLSSRKLKRYQKLISAVAKSLDTYLVSNHIGEFQAVSFYHRLQKTFTKAYTNPQKAVFLKKALGTYGDVNGKAFCKGLVEYYELLPST